MSKRSIPDEKISVLIREYESGKFVRELAREFNVSNTTIKNYIKKYGIKLRNPNNEIKRSAKNRMQDKNSFWKGGKVKRPDGYIRLNLGNKLILEHRFVAEKMLGRKLKPNEIVHHINGVKDDNRPENLKIMTKSEHSTLHGKEKESILSKEEFKSLLDNGYDYKTFSNELGCSVRTFYNLLDRYNLRNYYERLMKNA